MSIRTFVLKYTRWGEGRFLLFEIMHVLYISTMYETTIIVFVIIKFNKHIGDLYSY